MLVLTRKVNEKIIINNNIVISIVDIKGASSVRIGIEAPKNIPVIREELKKPDSSSDPNP